MSNDRYRKLREGALKGGTRYLAKLGLNLDDVALATMWRDAGHHRSPNAGWPEAAMAGALRIRLSGPRIYEGRLSQEPWLNAEAPDPSAADLNRALALYRRAMFVLAAGLALLAVL